MITIITIHIVHDDPNIIEYLKLAIKNVIADTSIHFNNISITHENK